MFRAILFLLAASLWAQEVHNSHVSLADIAAGEKSFHSHCAPCHGYNAEGGRGPNLTTGHFFHGSTDADIFNNITNGIPGTEMPSIFFSPDRVWQIVAYIRSLNATTVTPPGNRAAGFALFRAKGCTQCHAVKGQGGELGPDLAEIGASRSIKNLRESIVDPDAEVPPQYWVVSFEDQSGTYVKGFLLNEDTYTVQLLDMTGKLHSYDKATVSGYKVDKHSIMPSYRSSLSERQLSDLVAYLWSLRPE